MNIVVADDHALFREGLRYLLAQLDGEVNVFEAADYDAAERLLAEHPHADLALVDLEMPASKGSHALENLIQSASTIPVVVLSAEQSARAVRRALDAGAMGYIPKYESSQVMLSALRLVLSGGVYLPDGLLSRAGGANDPRAAHIHLTARQLDVLRALAHGKSNEAIGAELGLALSTVKAHVGALLTILNAGNRTQALIAARTLRLLGD